MTNKPTGLQTFFAVLVILGLATGVANSATTTVTYQVSAGADDGYAWSATEQSLTQRDIFLKLAAIIYSWTTPAETSFYRIYPQKEIPFAGHLILGTAYRFSFCSWNEKLSSPR